MKKIALFVCMLIIGFVNAQENDQNSSSDKLNFAKGTSFVNGGIFLNSTNTETTTTLEQEDSRFGFGINSSYAYAISDDLFIGLGLGYIRNKRENDIPGSPVQETTSDTFRIFPYIRYYKGIGKRLAFFVQGETQFSTGKTKSNGEDFIDTNSFFIGARPGLTYMVSKCLAIETTIGALGYTSEKLENRQNNAESDAKGFNFSLNTSNLVFGLSYYF
ncbi:outer membrane beta-barrel protein [Kordia jejudonensis]|uniref:outer membrane beta-barrel protein n=1 Tax=Kordia jejudonensis TaxID=1348245 RepID=UPI000628FBA9|nr:outer membrane beta-barrel protein [Kordia jejudonensis]